MGDTIDSSMQKTVQQPEETLGQGCLTISRLTTTKTVVNIFYLQEKNYRDFSSDSLMNKLF